MNIETVNELIATLESAGELSIKERKYLELAKAYQQLAAENVGLKKFIQTDCFMGHIEPETFYEEEVTRYVSADGYEPETPATDRIVAGIKADALPANIAEIIDSGDLETICYESERSYAEDFRLALYNFRQLREGADK
ncbi:hypothetical protein [Raoultella ornithinolytica]|uniref:hypothetical protein n=1 Tax=Raoultella ornithinolytica TaxID=54291 RepID=UPI002350F9A0|nr:hypothetical protein [Raoultella ornithinolytica]MDC7944487.1 hypothetical protein [Raoultella ornithinolytica]